ncbi:hypothetical protein L9F63_009400, partial [Diploptera punctata]
GSPIGEPRSGSGPWSIVLLMVGDLTEDERNSARNLFIINLLILFRIITNWGGAHYCAVSFHMKHE